MKGEVHGRGCCFRRVPVFRPATVACGLDHTTIGFNNLQNRRLGLAPFPTATANL